MHFEVFSKQMLFHDKNSSFYNIIIFIYYIRYFVNNTFRLNHFIDTIAQPNFLLLTYYLWLFITNPL